MSVTDRESPPRQGETGTEAAPLSHGQRALWFVHSLAPESIAYQGMYVWRLAGEVDAERLDRALAAVVDRHASLRTTFALAGGRPVQRVHGRMRIPLAVVDARGVHGEELDRRLLAESERPYDLVAGPLIRPQLHSLSPVDHRLLLAIHHIVLDHWSIAGLMDELAAFYRDPAAVLSPPPATYEDFVDWQAQMLAGPIGQRHRDYWRRQMGGERLVLELPTDRPRPAVQTFRGAYHTLDLDPEVVRRLQSYAARRGSTLFMVLLGAFQVLLHRYTGQDDVVVGTPMAGRGAPQFERVVGYFTNLVPLRAHLAGDPSFETFLHQVRGTALDGLQHQDYPFSLLVEQLGVTRDPSRAPIVDVIFAWEGAPPIRGAAAAGAGPQLDLELVALRQLGAAVDTAWSVFHKGASLAVSIQYNADLFAAASVAAMTDHFAVLLAGIAADPARRVSRLPLLPAAEHQRLLTEFNATAAEFPAESCFHRLFEEQVARTPQLPAVACGRETLTYAELDARANRWARELRRLGVGPEVRVGLCVDRSADLVVATLAVLKAGGAFVPLDPAYPPERLAFMLADARIPVLLAQSHLAPRLSAHGARVVEMDRWPGGPATEEAAPAAPLAAAGDVAYVIYTSGSTGRPKGVMVEHRGLVNVSTQQRLRFGLTPGVRVLQFASLSFDACVFEMAMALAWGGCLHLAPREELMPGPALGRFLGEHRIQLVVLPPSALAATSPGELPDLATITVAGERCPDDLPDRWARGRQFFNLYGPTEATIWSSCAELAAGACEPATIGRPIGNTRLYVLDPHQQMVPVGVAGELVIGGAGVARGYLGRPALTAERFIPDPFGPPGARLYRTGDRVRQLPDGRLEFLGRLDHQVKLRGYRIELGEIEALLAAHPAVCEAVAVIRQDGGQGERLVGYVAAPPASVTPEDLKELLRERVPEYMVPAHVVVLPSLPLTPNGKIDRKALPAPDASARGGGAAPEQGLEARIAEVWGRALGVAQVGRQDNFFDLGGHSLLLPQVHEDLERLLGRPIPISDLFRFPTVAALAGHLDPRREAAAPMADAGALERAELRRQGAGRLRRRRGDEGAPLPE